MHHQISARKVSEEKECGDRLCTMELRFAITCTIYVDVSDLVKCDYPCSFKGCTPEFHHSIECPYWTCSERTTTTPSSTTPTTPTPSGNHDCSSPLCQASVGLNAVVLFIGLVVLSVFLKKKFRSRPTETRSLENPLFDESDLFLNQESRTPIIRSRSEPRTERIPLLEQDHRAASIPFISESQRSTSNLNRVGSSSYAPANSGSGFTNISLTTRSGFSSQTRETAF